jgi:hypothetical protein
MSEANVEVTRRHYEIRHGKGGKRRKVGRDDWSREHPAAVDRARTEMRSLPVSHHRRIVARTGQADPPIDGRMTANNALPDRTRSGPWFRTPRLY